MRAHVKKRILFFSVSRVEFQTLSLALWKNVCWGGTMKGKEALIVPVWRRIFDEAHKP
jgi:hypothetical protein